MAGLPRSGNTLLSSILNQNPNLHVGPNSPVSYLTFQLKNVIPQREEYLNFPRPDYLNNILKSTIEDYYKNVNKSYVIDRSGIWGSINHIEIIKQYFNSNVNIICPVRNILEILASFITLANKNPNNFIDKRISEPTNENRCEFLMKKGSMIDICLESYYTSYLPGYENYFHFIEYNDLIFDTKNTLKKIYNFLEMPEFNHSLNNIQNYKINNDTYNDSIYGMDLHNVRNKIEKISASPYDIFSEEIIKKYSDKENWK